MRYSWLPLGLLLAAFLAFVGTAVGAAWSVSDLVERDRERTVALRTQTDLQRLLTLLVDVETGQRGFIITGQVPFLRPYEAAVNELSHLYADLRGRLVKQGANERLLRQLDDSIKERLVQVNHNIAQRMTTGDGVLKDLSAYVDGKRVMDELRFQVEQLQAEQQHNIAEIDAATEAVNLRTQRLTKLLPGVGLVMLLVALMLLLREYRRRDQAEMALQDANANLELQVNERTAALTRALQRIQSFAIEQDRSIEEERRRLAREVHDQIGQVGTAIKMLAISLRSKLKPRVEPLVDELQEMADEGIRAARQISAALRPPLLDELGVEAALGHYLQTLERQSGLTVQLALSDAKLLTPEQGSQLFRIVQEACTNVLRHAGARSLLVTGRRHFLADQGGFELEIIDDGRGPGDTRADASGLRNMRERAAMAGGLFEFGPAPECGAKVRVWLPLAAEAELQAQEDEAWA